MCKMDTRSGEIFDKKDLGELSDEDLKYLKEMSHFPTPRQRLRRKVGRNEPCPCGSGHKFKRCCLFRQHLPQQPSPNPSL